MEHMVIFNKYISFSLVKTDLFRKGRYNVRFEHSAHHVVWILRSFIWQEKRAIFETLTRDIY